MSDNELCGWRSRHVGFIFQRYHLLETLTAAQNVEVPLANFFGQGLLLLREKLGPILWQFPPNFKFDATKMEAFFRFLPRDTAQAATLARRHDARLKGRAWTKTDETRPVRHACEVRHESFNDPEFIRLLRLHKVALVVADTAGKWPFLEDVTSKFIYGRLHGDKKLYVSGYTKSALAKWRGKIEAWSSGKNSPKPKLADCAAKLVKKKRDVFLYFDNDVKVRAPFDAMSLAHALGLGVKPGKPPPMKSIGEEPRTEWHSFRAAQS